MSQRIIIVVIILVLIISAVLLVFRYTPSLSLTELNTGGSEYANTDTVAVNAGNNGNTGSNTTERPKKVFPDSLLPKGFPKEFNIEPQAKVIKNFDAYPGGNVQASREYISMYGVPDGFDFYKSQFVAQGWTIREGVAPGTPLKQTLVAEKGKQVAQVSFKTARAGDKATIFISFVERF